MTFTSTRSWPGRRVVIRNTLGLGIAGVVVVLLALALLQSEIAGVRWLVVETPSMGTAAPVGTLVLNQPTSVGRLRVGDIISFHPPSLPAATYTHRIAAIAPDGGITTRGDINGASDPWVLRRGDLVGRVVGILPGVGWALRAVPLLVIGGAVVVVVTRFVRSPTRRAGLRVAGFSLTASVTAFILHPFTGMVILATSGVSNGARATVVSTGLLPIRVSDVGGGSVALVDGQVGHVAVQTLADDGVYRIASALELSPWQWAIFIAACCTPLLYTLIIGLPPDPDADPGAGS